MVATAVEKGGGSTLSKSFSASKVAKAKKAAVKAPVVKSTKTPGARRPAASVAPASAPRPSVGIVGPDGKMYSADGISKLLMAQSQKSPSLGASAKPVGVLGPGVYLYTGSVKNGVVEPLSAKNTKKYASVAAATKASQALHKKAVKTTAKVVKKAPAPVKKTGTSLITKNTGSSLITPKPTTGGGGGGGGGVGSADTSGGGLDFGKIIEVALLGGVLFLLIVALRSKKKR